MIDKKIIKQRKAMYGSNFECIADKWSEDTGIYGEGLPSLTGQEVAMMMAHMKQCRIDAIDEKLSKFPSPEVGIKLHEARRDSVIDMANYLWIADNYNEYKEL